MLFFRKCDLGTFRNRAFNCYCFEETRSAMSVHQAMTLKICRSWYSYQPYIHKHEVTTLTMVAELWLKI